VQIHNGSYCFLAIAEVLTFEGMKGIDGNRWCHPPSIACDEFCTKAEPFCIPPSVADCCDAADTQRVGYGIVRGGSIAGVICF
jgi:hypothetical protein